MDIRTRFRAVYDALVHVVMMVSSADNEWAEIAISMNEKSGVAM